MRPVSRQFLLAAGGAAALALVAFATARADDDRDRDNDTTFMQVNLVSNQKGQAQTTDPNLQNAWGVANAPNSPIWISDNNDGLSTLYDGKGDITPLVVTIPLPMGSKNAASTPTGMVWNPTTAFTITNTSVTPNVTQPATFIFDTEDGTISGWQPAVDPISATGKSTATLVVDNSGKGAVYKGLAFATNVHGNFLLATNFAAGTVEVYDSNFKPAMLDGTFSDPTIPAGFAPFGIANIDNDIFVTYAKQNAQKNDVVAGAGEGFVNVFSTDGVFIRRFASRGVLNAPWGVVRATQHQGRFSGDILIGNFGDKGQFAGWINAWTGGQDNDFAGELRNPQGRPISIDGLWSLFFGTFLNSDGDTLYFTAGPNNQTNGLFGKLVVQTSP